ncbi:lysozyme [Enterobacteriaceae bacterium LUAb1]
MRISNNGVALIKREEGERLECYLDSCGIPTIGVGHIGVVNGKNPEKGMVITQTESTQLLIADLTWVEKTINSSVTVPITQNQYDALCSLIFNIGAKAFRGSTVLRQLNMNNYTGAADAFLMWKRAGSHADILLARRQRERKLFLQ